MSTQHVGTPPCYVNAYLLRQQALHGPDAVLQGRALLSELARCSTTKLLPEHALLVLARLVLGLQQVHGSGAVGVHVTRGYGR